MITYLQAVILGAIQGITELFPISSLGHTVVLPSLFGWTIDQHADFFVLFLVATHFATALVLLGYFYKDWLRIASGFLRSLASRGIPAGDTYARLAWLIIVATIPAGLLGLVFEHTFTDLFATPATVALFLVGNGVLLYGAELLRRRAVSNPSERGIDSALANLSFGKALGVGCMQALALFPGFSRTGASLAGGLFAGLSHESAARFSFLLATPIIFAAAVLKLPKLLHAGAGFPYGELLAGALAAAVMAYLAVRYLTHHFKTKTLVPFAVYCIVFGLIAFFLLH